MNTKNTRKHLHLTLDDRIEIQECLSHGMTFKGIGQRIRKDSTTVSKEVKKHISISPTKIKRADKDGTAVVAVCPKLLKPHAPKFILSVALTVTFTVLNLLTLNMKSCFRRLVTVSCSTNKSFSTWTPSFPTALKMDNIFTISYRQTIWMFQRLPFTVI